MSETTATPVADPVAGVRIACQRLVESVVIDVSGADAVAFLQGQFCNDVVSLQVGQAHLTGYCTPKGRLIATPLLMRGAEGFRLVLPDATIAAAFFKRLSMFVMRADVQLTLREDLAVLGLFGDGFSRDGQAAEQTSRSAADTLSGLPARPEALLCMNEQDGATLLRWHDDPAGGARWLAVASAVVVDALAGDAIPGDARWRLGDIRAGQPSVRAGTAESFVPQMMNMREVGALSFTKGCYPGQEIVARSQYLGKQKRHMRRFIATGAGATPERTPAPGAALGEAGIAEVVDAIATPDGIELLAIVRIGAADHGLPVGDALAVLADLPYDVPEPETTRAKP